MTPQQKAVLDFVRAYIGERGYAPTIAEIGKAVGSSSKSVVHRLIEGLVARGLLMKRPNMARALFLPDTDYGAVELLKQVHAFYQSGPKFLWEDDPPAVRIRDYLKRHGVIQ